MVVPAGLQGDRLAHEHRRGHQHHAVSPLALARRDVPLMSRLRTMSKKRRRLLPQRAATRAVVLERDQVCQARDRHPTSTARAGSTCMN